MPGGQHSSAVEHALAPLLENLSTLLSELSPSVEQHLRENHRSRLAKLVSKLPETAETVLLIARHDLPVSSAALGLAAAYHCRESVADYAQLLRHADTALIMLGVKRAPVLLDIISQLHRFDVVPRCELQGTFETRPEDRATDTSTPKYPLCAAFSSANFTTDQFKQFFTADKPVVIREMAGDWPATQKWSDPQYLSYHHGHRTVPIEHTVDSNMSERFMLLRDVLERMLDGDHSATAEQRGSVYLAQHPLLDYLPELARDISQPEYMAVARKEKADLINLWLGSRSTGSKLHFDSADNFLVQIVGQKRVVLFSPQETPKLYVDTSSDRVNASPINVDAPDSDAFPLFEQAAGTEVTLQPGDALYIPAGHWHFVKALSASISVNFWF